MFFFCFPLFSFPLSTWNNTLNQSTRITLNSFLLVPPFFFFFEETERCRRSNKIDLTIYLFVSIVNYNFFLLLRYRNRCMMFSNIRIHNYPSIWNKSYLRFAFTRFNRCCIARTKKGINFFILRNNTCCTFYLFRLVSAYLLLAFNL